MRTGAASAASAVEAIRHNENDVTMTIAGLWRYGDWRHVATGCTALVDFNNSVNIVLLHIGFTTILILTILILTN